MLNRRRGLRAVIATMGLIGSILVVQATLQGAAHARCSGPDNEITSTLIINGSVAVSEVPVTGTCNGNHFYQANYRSHYAGWRASVWLENNGWVGRFGNYNTAWYYYQLNDGGSAIPGTAAIHLCLDDGTTWYCGWGDDYNVGNAVNHNLYGTNYGF
jgi:hypothetical protein